MRDLRLSLRCKWHIPLLWDVTQRSIIVTNVSSQRNGPKSRHLTTNLRCITSQKLEDLYLQAFSTSALSAQRSGSRPDRFAPCPLNKRLHGPHSCCGKNCCSHRESKDSSAIQPVAWSLYFLSYPCLVSLYIPDSKFKQQSLLLVPHHATDAESTISCWCSLICGRNHTVDTNS